MRTGQPSLRNISKPSNSVSGSKGWVLTVLGKVVPFNYITDLGNNVLGVEVKATTADDHRVGCAGECDCPRDLLRCGASRCSRDEGKSRGKDDDGLGEHVCGWFGVEDTLKQGSLMG